MKYIYLFIFLKKKRYYYYLAVRSHLVSVDVQTRADRSDPDRAERVPAQQRARNGRREK